MFSSNFSHKNTCKTRLEIVVVDDNGEHGGGGGEDDDDDDDDNNDDDINDYGNTVVFIYVVSVIIISTFSLTISISF
jgi:hypothetical protein